MKLFAYFGELGCVTTKLPVVLSELEDLVESLLEPPMYRHQGHYLCFNHDFDNEDDDDDASSTVDKRAKHLWLHLSDKSSLCESPRNTQASLPLSIIPITTAITAAVDLLLTLINQAPATPPPLLSPLSPFNLSYIEVTPS